MDSQDFTIAGKRFPLSSPYAEGHVLTAAEAAVLNQTRRENVRNNATRAVKAGKWGEAEVAKYDEEYAFGARKTGRRSGAPPAPVMTEAKSLIRATLTEKLKGNGQALPTGSALSATVEAILSGPKGATFIEVAQQRIAARQEAAAQLLNEISAEDVATA